MKTYSLNNKTVILDLDDDIKDASLIISNNLKVIDNGKIVWELDEAIKNDACVQLNIISDEEIEFITFNGLRKTLNLKTLKITMSQITK